jgi:hemolysin activation/secretion protein
MTGNYHQQLPRLFEADLSANIGVANIGTPIYEQPSLGGAEVLRGFRKDDAIGRRLWSLQNELWAPIPGFGDSQSSLSRFLRKQVRLAGFVDVGAVEEATGSKSGTRTGPGLGARLIFFPVVMKLDWAYGLGDAAVGRGHGRVYFSVSTNTPF